MKSYVIRFENDSYLYSGVFGVTTNPALADQMPYDEALEVCLNLDLSGSCIVPA